MKVEFTADTRVDIDLENGKTVVILHNNKKDDELLIIFQGKGHRHIKEVQNRSDGHSSVTLTKQE